MIVSLSNILVDNFLPHNPYTAVLAEDEACCKTH